MDRVFDRYFEAIEVLRQRSRLHIPELCEKMGVDKGNFYRKLRGERGTAKIPVQWLSTIVVHYGVSAEWLLVGKGKMFN